MQKKYYELSHLSWSLKGYNPYEWKLFRSLETGCLASSLVGSLNASIPCSVQKTLLDNGIIKDWNIGLNSRDCEWVENRHWIFSVNIPDQWFAAGTAHQINFKGLDYSGWIYFNGVEVAVFDNAHLEYRLDLTGKIKPSGNALEVIFDNPPKWLGQFGYTSQMKDFKPRFNYTWDWCPRLVQIGIWDDVVLEVSNGSGIEKIDVETDCLVEKELGTLSLKGNVTSTADSYLLVELLNKASAMLISEKIPVVKFNSDGFSKQSLKVAKWWPNGLGDQNLYSLNVRLYDGRDNLLDQYTKKIGFKHIDWLPCENAPKGADNWICSVNGKPVFIKGVNWTPVRPNFADVKFDDYKLRVNRYKQLGFNLFRVWGGAYLEKESFYDLCDELGILVWQELPLSSSGIENYPPDDQTTIDTVAQIAASFVERRKHHVSLLMWCGGNELRADKQSPKPLGRDHPMVQRLSAVFNELDPNRRFLPTTPFGPSFDGNRDNYGKGLHWAVNGPWKLTSTMQDWQDYWENDDSLIRTEVGCPGPSPVSLIEKYCGDIKPFPCKPDNPLWQRNIWWCEWNEFINETGQEPLSLDEYVRWGQKRQSDGLNIAIQNSLKRFPKCAGIIIWMGHDCFPCTANTSILDFDGNVKPSLK